MNNGHHLYRAEGILRLNETEPRDCHVADAPEFQGQLEEMKLEQHTQTVN